MMLRRLAGYLRHDNWFTVILELVVVVVGLFLAFQLDRWYESQRLKADLQVRLASLAGDFTETDPKYAGTTIRHNLATLRTRES
jgi:hypothetical protein